MRRSDPSGDLLLVPPDKSKHIHAHKLGTSRLKALICHGNRVFGFVLLSWWFGHASCRKMDQCQKAITKIWGNQ